MPCHLNSYTFTSYSLPYEIEDNLPYELTICYARRALEMEQVRA